MENAKPSICGQGAPGAEDSARKLEKRTQALQLALQFKFKATTLLLVSPHTASVTPRSKSSKNNLHCDGTLRQLVAAWGRGIN
eukprot:scaffold41198_cov60-Phaeocystis_antarctica.AAC.1